MFPLPACDSCTSTLSSGNFELFIIIIALFISFVPVAIVIVLSPSMVRSPIGNCAVGPGLYVISLAGRLVLICVPRFASRHTRVSQAAP